MRLQIVERTVPLGARVVCLSDIHGNRFALDAVLREARLDEADLVIVHGDIVNRGPCSDAVWDRLAALVDDRWVLGSGNHERYVRRHLEPGPAHTGVLARVHASSAFACRQLGARARALVGLPDAVRVGAPGLPPLLALHASLAGDEAGLHPELDPATARTRAADAGPGVWVVGHIHRRYDFWVGETRVVNAGSVGSACDGDRRAGFVELGAEPGGWRVALHRVAYDVEAAARDFFTSGFMKGAGPVGRLIHREWALARPVVHPWLDAELPRVVAGEIDLERSVGAFLESRAPVGRGA